MASYSSQQVMDEEWQIARKVDRLDMGTYDVNERFNRLVVIFGLQRAIDPKDADEEEEKAKALAANKPFRSIDAILAAINEAIRNQRNPEQALKMKDKETGYLYANIDEACDGIWYDISEVNRRCKIMSKVKASEEQVR